jgi:hypothetical protein
MRDIHQRTTTTPKTPPFRKSRFVREGVHQAKETKKNMKKEGK